MVALTTYRCWQKQYIICWNVPIARSFSECQTKKKQRSHHIHQVETCRVSSEVPLHCFTGGVRVKLVIILSLLEEYSSILEKKKLWNHTLMHTSRTFLHFEAQTLQVSRRKDWVPSFEFWGARSKVFMWNYFCTVTQPFRDLHHQCLRCSVLY